jgi:hypothetical protein
MTGKCGPNESQATVNMLARCRYMLQKELPSALFTERYGVCGLPGVLLEAPGSCDLPVGQSPAGHLLRIIQCGGEQGKKIPLPSPSG